MATIKHIMFIIWESILLEILESLCTELLEFAKLQIREIWKFETLKMDIGSLNIWKWNFGNLKIYTRKIRNTMRFGNLENWKVEAWTLDSLETESFKILKFWNLAT